MLEKEWIAMIRHVGGFLGEIRDPLYDEAIEPAGSEDMEFGTAPLDEGQREPNEPTLPGSQPEQTPEERHRAA